MSAGAQASIELGLFHFEFLDAKFGSEFSDTDSFDGGGHVSNGDSRVANQSLLFSHGSSIFGIQLDLGLYEVGPLFIESPGDVERKGPLPVVAIGFGNIVIGGFERTFETG